MSLPAEQQLLSATESAHRILIAFPHAASLDAVAAACGLAALLRAHDKQVDVIGDGFVPRAEHVLLPGAELIKSSLTGLQHFILSVPLSRVKLEELTYAVVDDHLRITLTPQSENWQQGDVRSEASAYRYDLAIVIGCSDLPSLGALYERATDFWHTVPVANVDVTPGNTRFGNIQLIDITAAALCEYVVRLADLYGGVQTAPLATSLLAGIIDATRNFKTDKVTPKTLTISAQLVERGGERERIVGELYRTRGVSTLRLWGRALARLRMDAHAHVAWALLSQQDFVIAGANPEELPGVLDELIAYAPDIALSFLLFEDKSGAVQCVLHANRDHDAMRLLSGYAPHGSPQHARATMTGLSLADAETEMLKRTGAKK